MALLLKAHHVDKKKLARLSKSIGRAEKDRKEAEETLRRVPRLPETLDPTRPVADSFREWAKKKSHQLYEDPNGLPHCDHVCRDLRTRREEPLYLRECIARSETRKYFHGVRYPLAREEAVNTLFTFGHAMGMHTRLLHAAVNGFEDVLDSEGCKMEATNLLLMLMIIASEGWLDTDDLQYLSTDPKMPKEFDYYRSWSDFRLYFLYGYTALIVRAHEANLWDYVQEVNRVAGGEMTQWLLAHYYAELLVLRGGIDGVKEGELACACVFLARLFGADPKNAWTADLENVTGVSAATLVAHLCTLVPKLDWLDFNGAFRPNEPPTYGAIPEKYAARHTDIMPGLYSLAPPPYDETMELAKDVEAKLYREKRRRKLTVGVSPKEEGKNGGGGEEEEAAPVAAAAEK